MTGIKAPGPSGNFHRRGAKAPTSWSVAGNRNIAWRKTLPETGQSAVISVGKRIFFTINKPVEADSQLGSDIVAYCCDADTGETIWTREIAAKHPLRLSGCFGDSTGPSPVSDGKLVCFFNASGRIECFDLEGKSQWSKEMMPVARTQPFFHRGNVVFIKQSYMPVKGHFTHEHKERAAREMDAATGVEPRDGRTCLEHNVWREYGLCAATDDACGWS